MAVTHEYQGGIEVFVVLLHIVRVILHRLPLVHRVEIEAGVFGLDGLEECSKGILEATDAQRSTVRAMYSVSGVPLRIYLQWWGLPSTLFCALHESLHAFGCGWRIYKTVLVG